MNFDLPDFLTGRANTVEPPPIEPLHVIAHGERLVRRQRRLAAAGAALAVSLAVGATAVVLDARGDRPTTQPANPDGISQRGARPLSYGQGQILHLGDRVLDTGLDFLSLDITDDGAALTTMDGAIWFTDGTEVAQVGSTLGGRIGRTSRIVRWRASRPPDWVVNDSSGSLLAWLEYPDGAKKPELVIYDSELRAGVARQQLENDGNHGIRAVVAVAGREVFLSGRDLLSTDDLWRYDVDSGALEPVDVEVLEAATRGVPRGLVSGSSAEEGRVLGHAERMDFASDDGTITG